MTKKAIILGICALVIVPVFSFAGDDVIYVDDSASGKEDGSSKHPYSTISEALDDADEDTVIRVAEGVYEENIEIPKGVEVYGDGAGNTVIKADDEDEPAVTMEHKTEIGEFTIWDGRYGIKVSGKSRATIQSCVIEGNHKDGIKIKDSKVDDKYEVSIIDNVIQDNGRAGIYALKSRISVIDNIIEHNESDGLDIAGGSDAWVNGNRFKNNEKTGLKMVLDGSEIWTKNNTFRDNEREGVEINAYGGTGRIDIKKAKFYENERYGVARVNKGTRSTSIWDGVTFSGEVLFVGNYIGEISPIINQ